jgi:type II secretory pathway pseudopilin PulG
MEDTSGKTSHRYMRLRPHNYRKALSNKGDTIVEVLIAIAIVSSVLAGAFTVTQKSSQAVRSSQERAEMLQLLQGQVELVRALALKDAGTTSADVFNPGSTNFCIKNNPPTAISIVHYSSTANPPTDSPAFCTGLGPGGLYNVAIRYTAATNTFSFTGWWNKIGGGTNRMHLSYRISPVPAAP